MNLTAVREPEQIVLRHFGESVLAAIRLFPDPLQSATLIDVGSGAGFPGLPIGILRPSVRVTLLEAHGKKATFLREVCRAVGLSNVTVSQGRAEDCPSKGDVVTLRAVEKFEAVLCATADLVGEGGRLALLIGAAQQEKARQLTGDWFEESVTVPLPGSNSRILYVAHRR